MVTRILLTVFFALVLGGCAIGTTTLNVEHDPLQKIAKKREGTILVRKFVDKRKEPHEYIGNKRNGFGMVLGHVAASEGVDLEALLTRYFAEALTEAGYKAVIQDAGDNGTVKFDAVVDGEIVEFWLDLYMKVWHNMEVRTRLLDPANGSVRWEKVITADQSNVLWVGATGEFEKVISESLTKALNQAATEYSSEEFARAAVARGNNAP